MPVNPDFEGCSLAPSGPYAVSSGQIAAFADAVGSRDPLNRDRDAAIAAGYRDVIAPPTFAVSLVQQCERAYVADPAAGIDFSRVVHGEQAFVHHGPITAGDQVSGQVTVQSVRSVGGNARIVTQTVLTRVSDEDDDASTEPLCTATTTLIVRAEDAA